MPMNNMAGPMGTWPHAHTQELIRLCDEKLSYRAISTAMNAKFGTRYSKNAVLGKALRIGINKESAPSVPGNCKPRGPYKPREPREPRKRIDTVRIVPANGNSNAMRIIKTVSFEETKLRCVEIVPRNVSLFDLEQGDCRYPYGAGPEILFCGHPKQAGSAYCTPHHTLCNDPPRASIRRFAGVAA